MTTIKLASGVLAIPMLSLTLALALAAAEVGGTPTDPAPSVAASDQNSESGNWRDETVGLGSSVDRARHREPSDPPIVERPRLRDETVESSVDRAPRDLREPFDE